MDSQTSGALPIEKTEEISSHRAKHTPGPWALCPKEEGYFPHVHIGPIRTYDYLGNGKPQCTSYLTINQGPSPEQLEGFAKDGNKDRLFGTTSETCIANARLIAAAPDMLAALKDAKLEIQFLCEQSTLRFAGVKKRKAYLDIEAAIAKAESGQ